MGPTRVTAAVPTPSHALQILRRIGSWDDAPVGRNNAIKAETTLELKKERPTLRRTYSQSRPIFLCRLNLRLRGLYYPGPEEHGPVTCESGAEKVDRSRATLRDLLTIPSLMRLASAILVKVMTSKHSGSQATNHDNCEPPLSFTIAHLLLPFHAAIYRPTREGEHWGMVASRGSFLIFHI